MPRPEKVQAVADIKERIQNAQAVFLAEYAGLSVSQQQTLRRELKANGAEFKVIKMTLARLAAAELEIDTLDDHLLGPTGMAIADGDAVAAAKVLKDFSKAHEVFQVKGGLLGLEYLSPERVSELADIEPRDVLLAKIAGLFAAPMGNVLGLFESLQRDVVGLTQALVEKREASGEVAVPAAEPEPVAEAEDVADAPVDAEPDVDAEPEAMPTASAEDANESVDAAPEGEAAAEVVDAEPEAAADEEPEASAAETTESADEADEVVVADDSGDAEAADENSEEDTAPSAEGDDKDQPEEAEEE